LIQSKAVSLAGVSAAGPQSRVATEGAFGIKGSMERGREKVAGGSVAAGVGRKISRR
jgi:hypothetical protein